MVFFNRHQAGQRLADKLLNYADAQPIVLALPRGGVPVAAPIAARLGASLDVLIVRKLGDPFQPELAVGALCETAEPLWDHSLLESLLLDPSDLKDVLQAEKNKIQEQTRMFRHGRKLATVENKVVIVVDDGLATGATMSAAIKYLKTKKPAKIVIAVPVGTISTCHRLRRSCDEIVLLEEPEDLRSVGEWYQDFTQVSDDEVVSLLKQYRHQESSNPRLRPLKIPIDQLELDGDLVTVPDMKALVIFAHGSASSRKSPRNQHVARELNRAGFGTLLFDLLSDEEARNRMNVFDIEFLSLRLLAATQWLRTQDDLKNIPFGYFGASTGAAAALLADSKLASSEKGYAIVSRGGRPDLAGRALETVQTPTLLLVGSQDPEVLELNQRVQRLLKISKLTIIPGATHLFEEAGTLEKVSELAIKWFNEQLPSKILKVPSQTHSSLEQAIEKSMIPLRKESDLDRLIESIKDTRVVMLGEATHGTAEFYEIRKQISQRLIEDHGFNFIAVEGDWPDLYRLHKYIQRGEGGSAKEVLMRNHRWPTWMWANDEVAELAEWMKHRHAGFYGLDVYSLFESIDEVVNYLKANNLPLADEVQRRYACFDPFEKDEHSYARSLHGNPPGCENEAQLNLQRLLNLRVKELSKDGEDLFSSQQNARIIVNAENYYRTMAAADASSWNLRDGHMMETLDRLLERAGKNSKAIVWAHNTHIGDYRATDMLAGGYVNLGGMARQSYGAENVALVGFGTYQGEVLAGAAWGRKEQVMRLPPAQVDSVEHHLHQAAAQRQLNRFYLLLDGSTKSPFAHTMPHRAVGVVYDPQHERRGNYVPTELSKRYDAFIFVDQTHALKSLDTSFVRGELPETWPTGL